MADRNLVIFDGTCGVCQRLREMAGARDRLGRLTFRPFQSVDFDRLPPEINREMAAEHLIFIDCDQRYRFGAGAFFSAMAALQGFPGLIGKMLAVPAVSLLLQPFYRLFARNRARISRWLGLEHCAVTDFAAADMKNQDRREKN